MGLDIRWPIGLMFSLIGVILVAFGLITGGSEIYKSSLGINVNLYWGLLLVAFGGWMLMMAWRGSKQPETPIRFVRFRPPRLERDADGLKLSLPHIRLDRALQFLVGDHLA